MVGGRIRQIVNEVAIDRKKRKKEGGLALEKT